MRVGRMLDGAAVTNLPHPESLGVENCLIYSLTVNGGYAVGFTGLYSEDYNKATVFDFDNALCFVREHGPYSLAIIEVFPDGQP